MSFDSEKADVTMAEIRGDPKITQQEARPCVLLSEDDAAFLTSFTEKQRKRLLRKVC